MKPKKHLCSEKHKNEDDTGFIFSQYYVGGQHTYGNINILIIILTSWRFCSDKLLYIDCSVRR